MRELRVQRLRIQRLRRDGSSAAPSNIAFEQRIVVRSLQMRDQHGSRMIRHSRLNGKHQQYLHVV